MAATDLCAEMLKQNS
jgi:cullin-associated NEDD8-dissociated protein 1